MRIDVILPADLPAAEMARLGQLAEGFGIGGVWVANVFATRDPFVNFVPLALETQRIRMGPIAISPFELHPQKMAHALLTLNELAQGRAQLVVGGGGGTAEALGHKPRRIVRAVRECVEILKQAIEGRPGPYRGELYQVAWLDTRWVSAPPPRLYVGANGPQMLRAAATYADGIMVSDFTPGRIRRVREQIAPIVEERGLAGNALPLSNFWAWHVKPSREEAHREARIWLAVRGTIYPDYIGDVVDEAEAEVVTANLKSFLLAWQNRSPEIAGVPEPLLEKIVDRGTSASTIAEIGREVERFREFRDAGLSEIALCIYSDPEGAIRLIGEHLVPVLA